MPNDEGRGAVSDVLLVREVVDGRDLVLAFTADGSPAWALDRGTGIQWWYPGGRTPEVRRAIAARWPSLGSVPVVSVSHSAPHPAIELGRRADASAGSLPPDAVHPAVAAWRRTAERLSARRPRTARGVVLALVASFAALVLVPALVAAVLGPPGGAGTTSPDGQAVPSAVQTADTPCTVLGFVAHDPAGHVLVCAPTSRSTPWQLVWRRAS